MAVITHDSSETPKYIYIFSSFLQMCCRYSVSVCLFVIYSNLDQMCLICGSANTFNINICIYLFSPKQKNNYMKNQTVMLQITLISKMIKEEVEK